VIGGQPDHAAAYDPSDEGEQNESEDLFQKGFLKTVFTVIHDENSRVAKIHACRSQEAKMFGATNYLSFLQASKGCTKTAGVPVSSSKIVEITRHEARASSSRPPHVPGRPLTSRNLAEGL
jgi:hypothetical protein